MRYSFPAVFCIVLILFSASLGASEHSDRLTPLMLAVVQFREDLVMTLLDSGANPKIVADSAQGPVSALSLAIDRGFFSIARRLMEAGADSRLLSDSHHPNPLNLPLLKIPLDRRIWGSLAEIQSRADSPDWQGERWALHRFARLGDWFQVRRILAGGMNPDTADDYGVTPLMTAAWHGQNAVISLLLDSGASASLKDFSGQDALCYAAAAGQGKVASLLIDAYPVRLSSPLNESPYYWALAGGHSQIMEILGRGGICLPESGEEGVSLLMVASWLSDIFAVRYLVSRVSNPAMRDEAGRSVFQWCAAAFERDRQSGRDLGINILGNRNYPVARILMHSITVAGIGKNLPDPDFVDTWSPGENIRYADKWPPLPSPLPLIPGDGDLTLYRILRDEEQGRL